MKAFGHDIPFHEDGHYFILKQAGPRWVGGADFKGNMKMFTYKTSRGWAFSNSFALLVDTVKSQGWPVTLRAEHLAAWEQKGAFWQQLWSFNTAVEEISLVPSHSIICVENGKLLCQKHETPDRCADYETAMTRFLEIWLGRAATLMQSPLKIDITGGVDSRVNLALFLSAARRFGTPQNMTFNCGAYGRHKEDFAVAKQLSGTYKFPLNHPLETDVVSLGGEEIFTLWRLTSLGSYSPLYLPPKSASPGVLHVTGGGGEGHRPFYARTNIREHLEQTRGTLCDVHFDKILHSIYQSIRIAGNKVPPMMLHYREFRDRLHASLLANYSVRIMPLASRHLYAATRFKTSRELDRNQVLFDVMSATTPTLMTQPYDREVKLPSADCLHDLLGDMTLNPVQGTCYFDDQGPVPETGTGIECLAKAAAHTDARDLVAKMVHDGKLDHPQDGISIHNALLLDLVGA